VEVEPGDIPESVTYLGFGEVYWPNLTEDNLPKNLTYLQIPRGYVNTDQPLWLPPTLTHVSYKYKDWKEHPVFADNHWRINSEPDN
jgi:hypothetical protein